MDRDREDRSPAQRIFRRGEPRAWLLRPGETENEHTHEYDALVAAKTAAPEPQGATPPELCNRSASYANGVNKFCTLPKFHEGDCDLEPSAPAETREPADCTNPVYLELRQIYCCKGAEFCRPTLEKAWKEIARLVAAPPSEVEAALRETIAVLKKADAALWLAAAGTGNKDAGDIYRAAKGIVARAEKALGVKE